MGAKGAGVMDDTPRDITLTVNGVVRQLRQVPDDLSLLDLLHEDLGLTGTKFGCGIGLCQACTVAMRSEADTPLAAVRACSTMVTALDGHEITTIEGLAPQGPLSPLQTAFLEAFAFQCGYCTAGFLMAAFVLLDQLKRTPVPRADLDVAIARACGDHICRCTGYRRYYDAIRTAVLADPGLVI
jgi:aerobic-type carbon monoxide dehydrogenase small subunit (CoxS/CutS family)